MSTAVEHTFDPGSVLGGRYRIVRALGEGGMGAVYEAVQIDLDRKVAIKVILPEIASDVRQLERFRREASMAARLASPHVVSVTDFVERSGEPTFIVMELLAGRSLLAELKSAGKIPAARACAITAQLLGGLEVAHEAGIVHRDLKPANVFLVPLAHGGELVKILDFGVAFLHESAGYARLTETGFAIGTPRYAAPEQLGGPSVDARADLWAAGVLLYAMVAGKPPFPGKGIEVIRQVHNDTPPDPRTFTPGLDAGVVQVIERAMRKSPDERFASAREMAQALAPFLAERTSSPSGAPVEASRLESSRSSTPSAPVEDHTAPGKRSSMPHAAPMHTLSFPPAQSYPPGSIPAQSFPPPVHDGRPSVPSAAQPIPATMSSPGLQPAYSPAPIAHGPPHMFPPTSPSGTRMPKPQKGRGWWVGCGVAGVVALLLSAIGCSVVAFVLPAMNERASVAAAPRPEVEEITAPTGEIVLPTSCDDYVSAACDCQNPLVRSVWCTAARTDQRLFLRQLREDATRRERIAAQCTENAADARRQCPR